MAEVAWSTIASLDLIVAYIEQFDPAAARRMGERLIAAGESLSEFPSRGRPAANGTRELVIVRPYILRYELRAETILILGIRHAAQIADPD